MSKNSKKGNKMGGGAPKSGGVISTKGFKVKPAVKEAATKGVAKPVQADPAKPTLKVVGKVDLDNRDTNRFQRMEEAKSKKGVVKATRHNKKREENRMHVVRPVKEEDLVAARSRALERYEVYDLEELEKALKFNKIDLVEGLLALSRFQVKYVEHANRAISMVGRLNQFKVETLNCLLDLVAEGVDQELAAKAASNGFGNDPEQLASIIPGLRISGVIVDPTTGWRSFMFGRPNMRRALDMYSREKVFCRLAPADNSRFVYGRAPKAISAA